MAFILLVFLTAIIGVLSFYLYIWTYWRRRGIPGPPEYPIVGSGWKMQSNENPPYLQLKEWTKIYGSVYGITEGCIKTLVISDPDLINEVFVKQYDNFHGRKFNPLQGDPDKEKLIHMFGAQGHRWKRLRAISSPTFSNNNLRRIQTTVEDCVLELLRHIDLQTTGGSPIDLLTFYQELTLDVISRIAMGETHTQMFKNPMLPYVRSVFGEPRAEIFLPGLIAPCTAIIIRKAIFSMPRIFKNPVVHIIKAVEEAVEKRIVQRMADEKAGIEPGEAQDFIDLFLNAKSDDVELVINEEYSKTAVKVTRQLTTDEIVGQCFVFLLAGFDTTALSLSFSSFLLATHPEIQKKLQNEVDRECPDPEITFDQLSKLKYMECVIKETLRLYPLGTLANGRRCMKATKIGKYEIEKDVAIQCDTWTLHTDKKIWGDDAGEFKPQRWESGDAPIFAKCGYIPFGLGPRQCIGMRLAYMEEKLALCHILRKYTMEVCQKTQIPLKLVGARTTQPESVWLNMTPRNE